MINKISDNPKLYFDELKEQLKYLYYAKALSLLADTKIKIEEVAVNLDSETLQDANEQVQMLIHRYKSLQLNALKGRSNFDVTDALGAFLIFDNKKARNVLHHASIYSYVASQISFQTLLDDLMIDYKGEKLIPSFYKTKPNGKIELSFINRDIVNKDLEATHFKGHNYAPEYTLKVDTITNYYEVSKRLLRFLRHYDNTIDRKSVV